MQARAVDEAGDHFAHVVGVAGGLGDDAVELFGVVQRQIDCGAVPGGGRWLRAERVDGGADQFEGVLVVAGEVVGDAGDLAVDDAAAEVFGGDFLAGGGADERRAAEEDGAGAVDDDRLIAHRGDVGTAGGAGAHHGGDLGDALGGHPRLVEEDAPEVVAVGEDFGLHGQEGSAGVDEVDAGQAVLLGDLLGAEVLLHRDGVIGAALHRRVVGHDRDLAACDAPDAGDDPRAGRFVAVHSRGGQRAEFEEGRGRIEQPLDALAGEQLAARVVALNGALAAGRARRRLTLAQLGHQAAHPLGVGAELGRAGLHRRAQRGDRVDPFVQFVAWHGWPPALRPVLGRVCANGDAWT